MLPDRVILRARTQIDSTTPPTTLILSHPTETDDQKIFMTSHCLETVVQSLEANWHSQPRFPKVVSIRGSL